MPCTQREGGGGGVGPTSHTSSLLKYDVLTTCKAISKVFSQQMHLLLGTDVAYSNRTLMELKGIVLWLKSGSVLSLV